ncbi:mCG1050988 [Mus musculus]|nr:mCG1050988 [Mus musculus]
MAGKPIAAARRTARTMASSLHTWNSKSQRGKTRDFSGSLPAHTANTRAMNINLVPNYQSLVSLNFLLPQPRAGYAIWPMKVDKGSS